MLYGWRFINVSRDYVRSFEARCHNYLRHPYIFIVSDINQNTQGKVQGLSYMTEKAVHIGMCTDLR